MRFAYGPYRRLLQKKTLGPSTRLLSSVVRETIRMENSKSHNDAASAAPSATKLHQYSCKSFHPALEIVYVSNSEDVTQKLGQITGHGGVLGFDLEWRPTFVKGYPENPVAVVQLASEKCIWLIQVSNIDGE